MLGGLLMVLLLLTSVFLILLVLVQRGRGGGLAGAFGGMGGQSAFGTKAGDLFTRITIITATFWIILCAASVKYFSDSNSSVLSPSLGGSASSTPAATGLPAADAKSKPGATTGGKAAESGTSEAKEPAGDGETSATPSGSSEKGE